MLIFYLVLGVLVGVLSGIIGLGGGIFIVPALVYFAHMTQHKAQGTSLAALLAPIGILAFWEYHKAGNADIRAALFIAIGFMVGGWLGGRWAQSVSDVLLRRVFAVVLIAIAVQLLVQSKR
jgi:uncharacterized protein